MISVGAEHKRLLGNLIDRDCHGQDLHLDIQSGDISSFASNLILFKLLLILFPLVVLPSFEPDLLKFLRVSPCWINSTSLTRTPYQPINPAIGWKGL